jgi:hypothetical protein
MIGGASEVYALATDFEKSSAKVASALFDIYKQSGDAFAQDWRNNARVTAGKAARQYPSKITSETRLAFGIEVETGPIAVGQGNLGRYLEFGSPTSAAHLDGARALPIAETRLARGADAAIGHLLP